MRLYVCVCVWYSRPARRANSFRTSGVRPRLLRIYSTPLHITHTHARTLALAMLADYLTCASSAWLRTRSCVHSTAPPAVPGGAKQGSKFTNTAYTGVPASSSSYRRAINWITVRRPGAEDRIRRGWKCARVRRRPASAYSSYVVCSSPDRI